MAEIPGRLHPVTYDSDPADTQEGVRRERVRQVRQSLAVIANVVNDQLGNWTEFLSEIKSYPDSAKDIKADLETLIKQFASNKQSKVAVSGAGGGDPLPK